MATPCYTYEGCEGPLSGSVVIVRRDAAVASNRADTAAIDTVSFGHLSRFAPGEVAEARRLMTDIEEKTSRSHSVAAIS